MTEQELLELEDGLAASGMPVVTISSEEEFDRLSLRVRIADILNDLDDEEMFLVAQLLEKFRREH